MTLWGRKGTIMTLEAFKAVAAAHEEVFVAAHAMELEGRVSQAKVWLTLCQNKVVGLTAKEHYAALPQGLRDRVKESSFEAIWSLSKRILGACKERGLDPADLVTTRGGLEACKEYLWPKPLTPVAAPKPAAPAAAPEPAPVSVPAAPVVVKAPDADAVIDQILLAARNLPADKFDRLMVGMDKIRAERATVKPVKKAASKKAA